MLKKCAAVQPEHCCHERIRKQKNGLLKLALLLSQSARLRASIRMIAGANSHHSKWVRMKSGAASGAASKIIAVDKGLLILGQTAIMDLTASHRQIIRPLEEWL